MLRTWFFSVLIWGGVWTLGLVSAPPAAGELVPDQIAILTDGTSPESVAVARHFATRRGIPENRIIKLDLGLKETISREVYEEEVVKQIAPLNGLTDSPPSDRDGRL